MRLLPFSCWMLALHVACTPIASPSAEHVRLPTGTRPELIRVLVPLDVPGRSCVESCADLRRVASSHQACLARCPGAQVEVGFGCTESPGALCSARIVAVPLDEAPLNDREALVEALAAIHVFYLVTAQIVSAALCEPDSRDPSCELDELLPGLHATDESE